MITCPYCEKESEDPEEFSTDHEDQRQEYQCQNENCEKIFVYTISIDISFYPKKADCLNGKDHDYKKTKTYPPEFAHDECTMCGDIK